MSGSAPNSGELRRNLVIWGAVGAVVGAAVGGLGFSDAGVNVQAGLVGLLAGALVLSVVTLLATAAAGKAPPGLLQALGGAFAGWLFAGVIWEQKFERKWQAQLAGLAIGLLFTLVLLNRERLARAITGKRDAPASKSPDEGRPS
jgi:hypothetical protein